MADKDGRRLDKLCSPPSTLYLVSVASDDGRTRIQADVEHFPHPEGEHHACYTLLEPGWHTVSISVVTRCSSRPTDAGPHWEPQEAVTRRVVHFKENTSTTPTATTATEDAATSTGTASEGERVLKVVYVAHTDSREPMFRHWMVDYRRPGPLAHSLAPFDHVLVTGGLHDVVLYSTPEDFATNLEAEYVPSLRFSVRNMSRITWAGMWSLHEQKQQRTGRQARLSSKLRSFAFDDVARKMAKRWGMNWLSTRYMTTPRPDLSADGTRYSWPISLATIELWLGSICPSSSHEPSRC
eukprot:jgi/Mesen1/3915/ME000208S02922